MGGKHKKYVYIDRGDGWYVKARVFKNRSDEDPTRYLVVGPKVQEPPYTFQVIRLEDLPENVRNALRPKLYEF